MCVYDNNFFFSYSKVSYIHMHKTINFNMYIYTPGHKIFFIKETYSLLKL